MRALVTGGMGLLGSNLVRRLIDAGHVGVGNIASMTSNYTSVQTATARQ